MNWYGDALYMEDMALDLTGTPALGARLDCVGIFVRAVVRCLQVFVIEDTKRSLNYTAYIGGTVGSAWGTL